MDTLNIPTPIVEKVVLTNFCILCHFSIHCQLLTRRQTSLSVALIPIECFSIYNVSGTQSSKQGAGQTTKATPIYVIHEEISDVWVNVSMTHYLVKKGCGFVSSKQGAGQATKATPIYAIHEISDVWVNVSLTPYMVKRGVSSVY